MVIQLSKDGKDGKDGKDDKDGKDGKNDKDGKNNKTRKIHNIRKTRKNKRPGLTIRYGATIVDHQGLTRQQTEKQPEKLFEPQTGKQYTLLMYDADAPNPTYLHWLLVNCTHSKQCETIMEYVPPNPPPEDAHYHRYMFELLEQSGPIDISAIVRTRTGFQAQAFKKTYGLKMVTSNGFYVMP